MPRENPKRVQKSPKRAPNEIFRESVANTGEVELKAEISREYEDPSIDSLDSFPLQDNEVPHEGQNEEYSSPKHRKPESDTSKEFNSVAENVHDLILSIKLRRQQLNMSQGDAAKILGTSAQRLGRVENGKEGCSFQWAEAYAKIVGLRLTYHVENLPSFEYPNQELENERNPTKSVK